LNPPKPDCAVCSFAQVRVSFDPEHATLGDLVGLLREELGYSGEFSIRNDYRLIYDVEESQLSSKLSDKGITNWASLTVVDDDDVDKDPRVNLQLIISARYVLYTHALNIY